MSRLFTIQFILFSPLICLLSILTTSTIAQTPEETPIIEEGFPLRRSGGGTRGDCESGRGQVAVIADEPIEKLEGQMTFAGFEVTSEQAEREVAFAIFDQQDNRAYLLVMKGRLADQVYLVLPELPPGKYIWYFVSSDNAAYHSRPAGVGGIPHLPISVATTTCT